MLGWSSWDVVVIGVAGYIAVTCLVRLMRRRRDALVDDIGRQVEAERARREEQRRLESRQKFQDRLRDRQ